MIFSKYIKKHYIDQQVVMFNYLTGSVISLLPEINAMLDEIKDIESLKCIHPDLYETFISEKFLVDSVDDDFDNCKEYIIKSLSCNDTLRLTINPTMDCNCKCWYCYEDHVKGSKISEETISGIIKFIESQYEKLKFRKLLLSFFGGEPLLCKGEILDIINSVAKICKNSSIELNLQMTTNGILLNDDFLQKLSLYNIPCLFQIAFDGNEYIHNAIKHSVDVDNPYRTTLLNINNALRRNFDIVVRFNFSQKNIDSFFEVLNDIVNLPEYDCKKIDFSLQKIWQVEETKDLVSKYDLLKQYISRNNSSKCDTFGIMSHCYGSYLYSYVINFNGDVFKCTARKFLRESRLGHLESNGSIIYDEDPQNIYDVRFHEACKMCSILPLCKICYQVHKETKNPKECPVKLTEEDKENQIKRYFDIILENLKSN